MPEFYDTHAHLDYPDFADDFPQLIARAEAAGITRMISIGTDLESSQRAIQLAEQHAPVSAVVGWHPNDAMTAPADLRPALRKLVAHPKVVAIGETGLDYYRLPSSKTPPGSTADDEMVKQKQAAIFHQQLEVAAEMGLNVVIHQRGDCLEDTLNIFEPFAGKVRGVFHCFASDTTTMQRVLALGSLVSFTGIVTFKNGQNIRDTLTATPLDRFMLETDCPFLAPVPYRGKRCEPAYVKEIAAVAAQVKGCSLAELSQATCHTAHQFFPKLKPGEAAPPYSNASASTSAM
jgi:TatD DNase family protein